jgi:hypothetical protein
MLHMMRYPLQKILIRRSTLLNAQETLLDVLQSTADELGNGALNGQQEDRWHKRMGVISEVLTVLEQPLNELDYVVKDGLEASSVDEPAGSFLPSEIGLARVARHFASVSIRFLMDVKVGVRDVVDYEESPLCEFELDTMEPEEQQATLDQQIGQFRMVMDCCDVMLGYTPMDHLSEEVLSVAPLTEMPFDVQGVRARSSCRRLISSYFADLERIFHGAEDESEVMHYLVFLQVDQLPDELQWYHGINAGAIAGFYHTLYDVTGSDLLAQLLAELDDGDTPAPSESDEESKDFVPFTEQGLDRMEAELDEALGLTQEADHTLAVAVHILRRAQVLEMDAEYVAGEFDSELVNAHVRRLRTYATSAQWREVCDNVQGILSEDEAPAGPSDALAMASEFRTLIGILDLIRPDFVANPAAMDSLYRLSETFDESLWRLTLNLEAPAA